MTLENEELNTAIEEEKVADAASDAADVQAEPDETAEQPKGDEAPADEDALIKDILEKTAVDDSDEDLPANVKKKIDREVAKRKQAEEALAAKQAEEEQRAEAAKVVSDAGINLTNATQADIDAAIDRALEKREQRKKEEERKAKQDAQMAEEAKRLQALAEKAHASREKLIDVYPDYDEVAGKADVNDWVIEQVAESSNPAGLMYFIGKNPVVAQKLKGMSKMEQVRYIAELDGKFQVESRAKKKSDAPKPIDTRGGGAQMKSTEADISKMTNTEFDAYLKGLSKPK